MSDRRLQHRGPRWGNVRPARPEWQLTEAERWAFITRQHFTARPVVERRWRVRTDLGTVTVVRKVR